MSRRSTPLAASALATAILVALAAMPVARAATDATPQTTPATNGTSANARKSAQNQVTLQTIVVTANHRTESVQHVAGGITALSNAFLDQIHATSFEQFAGFVPGLSFNAFNPTSDIIALRGVTTGGTQLSGGVGIYFGQVPIGASTPFGTGFESTPINTFDLQRVEVLKGPQGTLYGANALGGAIKYVPAAPNLAESGTLLSAGVSSTSHAGTNFETDVLFNAPLSPGKVALRVDGMQQYNTGFGSNPYLGTDNEGSAHTTMGRAQLLAQITPDLSVNLMAYAQKIHANGLAVGFRDFFTGQPVGGTYEQQFSMEQPASNDLRVFSGTVKWQMPWATLTSITAYQNDNNASLNDTTDQFNPIFNGVFGFPSATYGEYVDTTTRKASQEFRLESPKGQRFEWLLGAFGSHESTHELVNLRQGAAAPGLLLGFTPFYATLPSLYKETSLFADGTWHFTDKFDVTVGARYSRNTQHYQQFGEGWLVVPVDPALTTHENATSKQNVTTWLLNPRYFVTKNFMLYAKAASGYRPGGPNFVLQLGQGAPTFQPDKLWNYELGEKATLAGGRATINADVYDIHWSKIQLTVNNGGVNQIENGGSAEIKGAEFSAAVKATRHLTLRASGAFTDAKLTSAVPALGLATGGDRLPFSARFNTALSATYGFDVGSQSTGQFTVSDIWVGDRTTGYKGSVIAPLYRLPGYNTANLDLALFVPHGIEVDVFLHNALNKAGQVSALTDANEFDPAAPVPVVLTQPRTIGLRVTLALGNPYP